MENSDVVKLEDVSVHYGGIPALEGVNLTVKQDDFIGIIGPNGGGKTTLLRVILGLVKPTAGKVTVIGEPPEKGRRHIGYVAQYNLFDRSFPASVFEVALMGRLRQSGLFHSYRQVDKEAVIQALETVEMLGVKDRRIGELSGGQQQRVFVARALVTEPRVLLLDEPMASVDPTMQTTFYELLEKLKKKMAVIMVSHDIGAVSIYVDTIACLNRHLYYHGSKEITEEELESVYQCPVEMIAHGVPHRVLKEHK